MHEALLAPYAHPLNYIRELAAAGDSSFHQYLDWLPTGVNVSDVVEADTRDKKLKRIDTLPTEASSGRKGSRSKLPDMHVEIQSSGMKKAAGKQFFGSPTGQEGLPQAVMKHVESWSRLGPAMDGRRYSEDVLYRCTSHSSELKVPPQTHVPSTRTRADQRCN